MSASQPLVSIIIPTYNCGKFLAQGIRSVLNQEYPHKEVIVIDDGSTDNTQDILQTFGDAITVFHQENAGAAVARNTGLQYAKGEYLAFLDADDLWLPGKLTAQVNYLETHPQVGMVYTNWLVWVDNGTNDYQPAPATSSLQEGLLIDKEQSGWVYHLLLFDSIVHTITVLVRKNVAQQVGTFDAFLRNGQDYDYWIRASRVTEIHKLSTPFAVYRLHSENNTTKPKAVNYEYEVVKRAVDRWGLIGPDGSTADPQMLRRRMAKLCFNFGYLHYWKGDKTIAHQSFKECLRHWPFAIKGWIYAGLSLVKSLRER